MKKYVCLFVLVVVLSVYLVSCGGDGGGSSTTAPSVLSVSSNVSGNWKFSGAISSNSCTFSQSSPGLQVGDQHTETVAIIQSGANVTGTHVAGTIFAERLTFAGTTNGNAVTLSMTNPEVTQGSTCSYAMGGGMEINLTNEATGTGSVSLPTEPLSGDCSALGLPCAIILTGSWAKVSSGASQSSPASTPTPAPQSTPTSGTGGTPSECTSDQYNCKDFSTQAEAQDMYERCLPFNGDIHRLDGDNNGLACDSVLNMLSTFR